MQSQNIGHVPMQYLGRERKTRTEDMFQCNTLDANVKIRTYDMFQCNIVDRNVKSEHKTCSNVIVWRGT